MPTQYTVIILPRAERDLRAIHAYVAEDSLQRADLLADRLEAAIVSLDQIALRHPLAP